MVGRVRPHLFDRPYRSPHRLPPGFRSMAAIASRPQVVEIESQVRLLLDGYLMISMQVAVAATECSTQFIQYLLRRWNSESGIPEHSDDLRLPATIHTPPAVALEADDPEPAVVCVVSALGARAAAFVVFTLP